MINECWNTIGVEGNLSCPELTVVTHCRNCPVYTAAGRSLLEREAPLGYRHEWTKLLAEATVRSDRAEEAFPQLQSADKQIADSRSIAIFRLGVEWLALPAFAFKEVTKPCAIHTLPHRSNEILLGLVNIRGEIFTCISLSNLLGVEKQEVERKSSKSSPGLSRIIYPRMLVVEIQGEIWVFPVDEIEGVYRCRKDEFKEVPAVVSKSAATYTKWIVNWNNKKVNYLDYELLFSNLKRRIL